MEFKEYWDELPPPDREKLAKACDTSVGHLRNISYGYRSCAEKLAIALERETRGKVRCETLRPDVDWRYLRNRSAASAAAGRS